MEKMKVEIWSDVVCPWCYIGKRRFEEALAQFPEVNDIEVEWKSFQLDPTTQTDAEQNVQQHLAKKYGVSLDEAQGMINNVTQAAEGVGLDFNLENAPAANTFKAHRMLHYAHKHGKQNETKELLLKAYFVENKNIDDSQTLLEIGKDINLNISELSELLNNNDYAEEVKADINESRMLGIRGVPFFVFDRKYGISGAQSGDVFVKHLEKAHDEWKIKNRPAPLEVIDGQSCSEDGVCD